GCPAVRRWATVLGLSRPPRACERAGHQSINRRARAFVRLAGPQGLEPRPTEPESVVLPLDDGPTANSSLRTRWVTSQPARRRDRAPRPAPPERLYWRAPAGGGSSRRARTGT